MTSIAIERKSGGIASSATDLEEGGEGSALDQGVEEGGDRIRAREVMKDGGGLEVEVTVVSAGVQDDSGLPGLLRRESREAGDLIERG